MKSESEVPVHEEFTYICGAVTQILKCGPWKDLSNHEGAPKVLFLVIPGNPGLPGYYRTFIKTLYSCLNRQYPVWVVGHAGQCRIPDGMKMTEGANELDDVFGLRGQIEHKLSFLKKNIPKDVKVVLIGHSVGAYIAMEIMKHAPQDLEIIRSMLLFPTVERMAQSPMGKILTPLVTWLRYIVYVTIYLALLLPESIRQYIIRFGAPNRGRMDESSKMTTKDLLNFGCIANVLYLASQEMRNVVERDNTAIRQYLKKLTFYYGVTDRWCPLQYYEEMKRDFPDGDIRLCEKGFLHAFVLDSSKEMAEMLADWLQEDLARL